MAKCMAYIQVRNRQQSKKKRQVKITHCHVLSIPEQTCPAHK